MTSKQIGSAEEWGWDPFSEMEKLQHEMNNLIGGTPAADLTLLSGQWAPYVDIYDSKDNLLVKMDLPGVEKDDVDISIMEGTLTIKGEKKRSLDIKEEDCYRAERSFGQFNRVVSLSTEIDINKATANFNNGVLELLLPKKEEIKPKQVKIEVK